jgi:hypothetical protein
MKTIKYFLFAIVATSAMSAQAGRYQACACSYDSGGEFSTTWTLTGFVIDNQGPKPEVLLNANIYEGNRNSYQLAQEACLGALRQFADSDVCPTVKEKEKKKRWWQR